MFSPLMKLLNKKHSLPLNSEGLKRAHKDFLRNNRVRDRSRYSPHHGKNVRYVALPNGNMKRVKVK